ncbi:hypothetical protein, partial [Tabrizicola soli]|uniref:hypothetical protein n=1 Tax=Tabrizicola soli TaxID=2185115 RepID=UPI001A7E3868
FSLLRVLVGIRKYRLTEAETRRRRAEAAGYGAEVRKIWRQGARDTPGSWCIASFLSAGSSLKIG